MLSASVMLTVSGSPATKAMNYIFPFFDITKNLGSANIIEFGNAQFLNLFLVRDAQLFFGNILDR
jgi:hypothetical protein